MSNQDFAGVAIVTKGCAGVVGCRNEKLDWLGGGRCFGLENGRELIVVGVTSSSPMKRKSFNWTLPSEIESRLGDTSYGRQRAILGGDHLLVVLHLVPSPGVNEREALVVLRRPDGRYLANGFEGGEHQLRKLLADYRARFEQLDQLYDAANTPDALFALLEQLVPVNRASTHLADALQSARDLVKEDRLLIAMRDESYEISRSFDLLVSDARLKLDYRTAKDAEMQSMQSARMAAAQHKLNVLAACTLPVTALAGILGMNITHGLEHRSKAMFWVVLGLGFLIGFAVKAWVVARSVRS
jgi:hypothetical protein